jgi:hypothetical protein
MEDKWYKSTEARPGLHEIVWGMFKGRDVELVHLALTESEYEKYFEGFSECSWYSLESEKCKSVTYWRPLIRPEKPSI